MILTVRDGASSRLPWAKVLRLGVLAITAASCSDANMENMLTSAGSGGTAAFAGASGSFAGSGGSLSAAAGVGAGGMALVGGAAGMGISGAPFMGGSAGIGGGAAMGGGAGMGMGGSAGASADAVSFYDFSYRLVVTCGNAICHVPGYYPPDFSNRDGDLHDILLNWKVEECGGAPIVVPGDPDASAMIMLVNRQCGPLFMPVTCEPGTELCIFPDELETFRGWIAGGALPD